MKETCQVMFLDSYKNRNVEFVESYTHELFSAILSI